jgi:dolichol kinase
VSVRTSGNPKLSFSGELQRKGLHFLTLVIPFGLLWLGKPTTLYIIVPMAVFAVGADVTRTRLDWANRLTERIFGSMMRPEELPDVGQPTVINGATWVLISSVLMIALFPEPIAAAGLAIFLIGDAAAALIGRRWGRIQLGRQPKTLEGMLAFIASAFLVVWFIPGIPWWIGLAGAITGAVMEALPGPLNDNLSVPLAVCLVMYLL